MLVMLESLELQKFHPEELQIVFIDNQSEKFQ